MKTKYLLVIFLATAFYACSSHKKQSPPFGSQVYLTGIMVHLDTLTFFDAANKRAIPVKIYYREQRRNIHDPVTGIPVIFNTGYGATREDYAYLANGLAADGRYVIVVIQQDLAGYAPLPSTGDIYQQRKPIWERGIKSIYYTVDQLKLKFPGLSYKKLVLMGHSNGGDMAMLIANENPGYAKTVITLDNRRMPFPRSSEPHIFSIRSKNQPADDGVLANEGGQAKYGIKIVKVNATHAGMGGSGTIAQQKEIVKLIIDYLNNE